MSVMRRSESQSTGKNGCVPPPPRRCAGVLPTLLFGESLTLPVKRDCVPGTGGSWPATNRTFEGTQR